MGKNKKNDKNDPLERHFKYVLSKNWEGILEEISEMNDAIQRADKKDLKKLKKVKKSNKIDYYDIIDNKGFKVRKKTVKMFKDPKFIDSMIHCMTHAGSLIKLIKRAISVLIVSLLSINCVKSYISKSTLDKVNLVFRYTVTC